MEAIVVKDLTHTYPAARRLQLPRLALRGVSFSVQAGEVFGLLGPNGGGKTTLFSLLSTIFPPTGGTATVFGYDVVRQASDVRRQLGVVFQAPSLDKKLSARENLWHQGHLYGLTGGDLGRRIDEALRRVGVLERAGDRVEVLSGGLKRRVEVAKGLLHRPKLLLLDEPSTGLDPGARRDLWDYLAELRKREGMTILVTTHLMEEAEKCDRVAILHEGGLVTLGVPSDLKSQIGGDVISVETPDPETLCGLIKGRFGGAPAVVDGTVRIERERGHEFIPQLVSAFPGQVTSVHLGKPTLEDVFIHHTGHRFWTEGEGANGL